MDRSWGSCMGKRRIVLSYLYGSDFWLCGVFSNKFKGRNSWAPEGSSQLGRSTVQKHGKWDCTQWGKRIWEGLGWYWGARCWGSLYCSVHSSRQWKGREGELHNQGWYLEVPNSSWCTSKILGGVPLRCLRCMQRCGSSRARKTLEELLIGVKPSVRHFRIFGFKLWAKGAWEDTQWAGCESQVRCPTTMSIASKVLHHTQQWLNCRDDFSLPR